MLSELGKVNKQTETSSGNGELQESRIQEAPEASEASEVSQKRLEDAVKVLRPNIDLIKTQSLESVKQNNLEKTWASVKEDNGFRGLDEDKKAYLRGNSRLSETAIENLRIGDGNSYYLKCRNEELAGRTHEITGVTYIENTITLDDVKIVVVVPEFASTFECDIPAEIWASGDREIFKYCTDQLRDCLEAHPDMKSQFNEQQLEQIMNGEPYIKGYTWHHSEIPGKMQLVDSKTHALSGHTGGNSIWCSGIR